MSIPLLIDFLSLYFGIHRLNKKMDGIIREYDVKRVEIEILRFLAMSGERNTAADIHRYLDLNKGQISKTLEHLCTMHYLESMQDKKDRRYMHYILSEEAKELVRRINAIWDDMHQQIMSGIQAEDRAIFNKVLNHYSTNKEYVKAFYIFFRFFLFRIIQMPHQSFSPYSPLHALFVL